MLGDAVFEAIVSVFITFIFFLILPKERIRNLFFKPKKNDVHEFIGPRAKEDTNDEGPKPKGTRHRSIWFVIVSTLLFAALVFSHESRNPSEAKTTQDELETLDQTELSETPEFDSFSGSAITGSGQIGGGLGSREVLNAPKFPETDDTRIVDGEELVINICVDADGNVIAATTNHELSTTEGGYLESVMLPHATKWTFSRADVDRQCGYVKYRFHKR